MHDPARPEERFDRFRLLEEIGRGGMGIVWHAQDSVLMRPVALKLLAPHLAHQPEAVRRFRREAEAVAALRHPSVALVLDHGVDAASGQAFIAFEWIQGRGLDTVLREDGALSLERVVRIAGQIASALDHAHARGVVHRDLKPSNVILDDEDRVTLVDFGLAWLEGMPTITIEGGVVGTPRYMAPEQLRGETPGPAADQYGLAVLLYELLAGTPPFSAPSTPALYQQQLHSPPPPIREVRPELPPRVERALDRALSKDPAERFPSVARLASALGDPPLPATPERAPTRQVAIATALALAGLALGWLLAMATNPGGSDETATQPSSTWDWPSPQVGLDNRGWLPDLRAPRSDEPLWAVEIEGDQPAQLRAADTLMAVAQDETLALVDLAEGERYDLVELGQPFLSLPLVKRFEDRPVAFVLTGSPEEAKLLALDLTPGLEERTLWEMGDLDEDLLAFEDEEDEADEPEDEAGDETEDVDAVDEDEGESGESEEDFEDEEEPGRPTAVVDLGDGTIAIVSSEGSLLLVEPLTGEVLGWLGLEEPFEEPLPPAAGAGAVFVADASGMVVAVDPRAEGVTWGLRAIGEPTAPPLALVERGLLVLGLGTGWIQALSLWTGDTVWLAQADDSVLGLAGDARRVYVVDASGQLYALDPLHGEELWREELASEPTGGPWTDGRLVAALAGEGRLHVFDAAGGERPAEGLALDAWLPGGMLWLPELLLLQADEELLAFPLERSMP